jgi:hypothetical protein
MRSVACLFLGSVLFASAGLAADQNAQKTKANQKEHQTATMSDDMRRAIEFERAKDRADARQAAIEARHPSVVYNNEAARSTDEDTNSRRTVKDPGPGTKK